jgi:hypothetical protein
VAILEENPEPVFKELKVTIPTKETIEKELTAASASTQEGVDAVKELGKMGDMHPKVLAASYTNTLKRLDQEQRKFGLLVNQKAKEIDECLGQIRYIKMTRAMLVHEMKDLMRQFKNMHEQEKQFQEEQAEIAKVVPTAPKGRGRRKSA